jgi:hypothetical protein
MTYLNAQGDYDYDDAADRYKMPDDFASYTFAVTEEDDPWGGSGLATMVAFCPIEYFEANGYMWDQYSPMEDKLPKSFSQCMEAMYEFDGTVEQAKATLIALGFTEHQGFTDFMAEHA